MQIDLENAFDELTSRSFSPDELNHILALVGDILRDEQNRTNPKVRKSLPDLVRLTNDNFGVNEDVLYEDKNLLLSELRVFINASAGSDDNRSVLLGNAEFTKFWLNMKDALAFKESEKVVESDIKDRIVLLVSQFCYETSKKEDYLTYLRSFDFHTSLLNYARRKMSDFDRINILDFAEEITLLIDVLNSLLCDSKISVTALELDNLDRTMDILSFLCFNIGEEDNVNEEVSEVIVNLSSILCKLISFEGTYQERLISLHESILNVLPKIPRQMHNCMVSKRNLFSASGNISSMKEYGASRDIDFALSVLNESSEDSYQLAAAYIALGNSIDILEKRNILHEKIEEVCTNEFVIRKLLNSDFNDIILYQSYHFLRNFMSNDVARIILDNYTQLIPTSEKIIAHEKYYREVSSVFFKFTKKLIETAFVRNDQPADVFDYLKLWNSLLGSTIKIEVESVFLFLLQGSFNKINLQLMEGENMSFVRQMVSLLLSSDTFEEQITIDHVLQKLKTLGIFFRVAIDKGYDSKSFISSVFNGDRDSFSDLLASYMRLLERLESLLINDELKNTHLHKIFCNNLKFVSVSTIGFIELSNSNQTATDNDLILLNEKCEKIFNYINGELDTYI